MLSLLGENQRHSCESIKRRSFLRIGGFTAFGASLSLAGLLRAEAKTPVAARRHKSLINIFLAGGPSHLDTFDLKPNAPVEVRGEFSPIDTKVPGIQIGESFPRLAAMMDRCAILRTVVGASGAHDAWQCMTGWTSRELQFLGGHPSIGAVANKILGPVDPAVPSFVGLAERTSHVPWSDPGTAGFLGPAFSCFKPEGDGLDDMRLSGISLNRLNDRKQLLAGFDKFQREVDQTGKMAAVDTFTQEAFSVLTSSKLLTALDISREDPRVLARYGDGKPYHFQYDGAPTVNRQLLLARRLIEAGVRCVSLSYGRWDSHSDNFNLVRDHGSKLDQCLSALIEDLELRGMLEDTTVIAWGEFGRSPQINKDAGRDHWPKVSCAFLAGGGMRGGQVVGATSRLGDSVESRPTHFQEVIATLYRNLGIDPDSKPIADQAGRPQRLVEKDVIRELI